MPLFDIIHLLFLQLYYSLKYVSMIYMDQLAVMYSYNSS